MSELEKARAELQRLERAEREAEWARRHRCRLCGLTEADGTYLTSFDIAISKGEEGHSELQDSFLCDEDLAMVIEALAECGLVIHKHGGICFMEDMTCPGATDMDTCPTPQDRYGEPLEDDDA